MEKSIVLCSGGLNSAVVLALAKQSGGVAAVHAALPTRAAVREAEAFEKLASHFGVRERLVLEMPWFGKVGGNARVDRRIEMEDALAITRTPSRCHVPGLIGSLLHAAFAAAQTLRIQRIWLGVSENLGPPAPPTSELYPDYSREYIAMVQDALQLASGDGNIRVETPLVDLSRGDVIRLGARLEVPFKLTWSCVAAADAPCQRCPACATRGRGFIDAAMPDPLYGPATAASV
ncbi:MAG: 7-cyano-7-deazaguanine synthase [Phycisphaerae bacterium]|nr:7-cyano-7-deazaguanine synthase [Phycisphaerae bacterium]